AQRLVCWLQPSRSEWCSSAAAAPKHGPESGQLQKLKRDASRSRLFGEFARPRDHGVRRLSTVQLRIRNGGNPAIRPKAAKTRTRRLPQPFQLHQMFAQKAAWPQSTLTRARNSVK